MIVVSNREYTVVSIQVIGSSMSIERIEVGKSNLLRPVTWVVTMFITNEVEIILSKS